MLRLLTRREAAAYLQGSTRTLDRYRRKGLLASIKLKGVIRFRAADIQALLAQHLAGR